MREILVRRLLCTRLAAVVCAIGLALAAAQPARAASLLTTVSVGNQPDDVAVNPVTNRVYVVNEEGQTVTVIDGATNTAVTTIFVGYKPRFVASSTERPTP